MESGLPPKNKQKDTSDWFIRIIGYQSEIFFFRRIASCMGSVKEISDCTFMIEGNCEYQICQQKGITKTESLKG